MASKLKLGGGFIGLLFLAVGVIKLVQGDDWVVWFILGFLFGGFGVFGSKAKESDEL